jgi:hypothetical protein
MVIPDDVWREEYLDFDFLTVVRLTGVSVGLPVDPNCFPPSNVILRSGGMSATYDRLVRT